MSIILPSCGVAKPFPSVNATATTNKQDIPCQPAQSKAGSIATAIYTTAVPYVYMDSSTNFT